jgi:hypothetical protein
MKFKNLYLSLSLVLIAFASCKKETLQNEVAENATPKTDLITLKSGVLVEKVGDKYVWQGDIVLSPVQFRLLDETGNIFPKDKPKNVTPEDVINDGIKFKATGIYPTAYNLWAMVRYTIHPNLTWDRLSIFNQAIAHWEATTNVRFYNATGEPTVDPTYGFAYPYVEVVNSTKNRSAVGRRGGRQELELAQFQGVGAAIHEIGHAIGLNHEQTRNDRDNYISINQGNLTVDDYNTNFQKITTNYYTIGIFDFGSIMMYGARDFAINPNVDVISKVGGGTYVAQRDGLSSLDRQWANSFYLPYVARPDAYRQLATTVYKPDNTVMTECERLNLQAALNNEPQPCYGRGPKNPPQVE